MALEFGDDLSFLLCLLMLRPIGYQGSCLNTELDQQQAAEPLICKEELWLPLYQSFTKAILCVDIKRCRWWYKYCITSRDLSSSEPSLTYQGNKQLSAYLFHRAQYLSGHFCLQKDIFFAFCSWSLATSEYKQLIPIMMIGLIMGDAPAHTPSSLGFWGGWTIRTKIVQRAFKLEASGNIELQRNQCWERGKENLFALKGWEEIG